MRREFDEVMMWVDVVWKWVVIVQGDATKCAKKGELQRKEKWIKEKERKDTFQKKTDCELSEMRMKFHTFGWKRINGIRWVLFILWEKDG